MAGLRLLLWLFICIIANFQPVRPVACRHQHQAEMDDFLVLHKLIGSAFISVASKSCWYLTDDELKM